MKPLFAAVVAVLAIAVPAALADTPSVTGYPSSMAATGDSITRAFDTCSIPYVDCPANSWSTGTNTAVNSQYLRILAVNPAISGHNYNDAKTGARMTDLNGQAQSAVAQGAQYVTILMGANDVCTSTVASMTPTATVAAQLQTALTTLSTGLPDARIFVASIPNVYHLWDILHTNFSADIVWGVAGICQSLLANPRSTSAADNARRQQVSQQTINDNAAIASVCAQFVHCRSDGGAAYNVNFTTSDVTTRDYFHPTVAGQAKAATATWNATFNFQDTTPPKSNAVLTKVTGGSTVTLSASDDVGVAGIEYRLGSATTWTHYTGPVSVATGASLAYRAVDVDGNSEASHTVTG